MTSNFFKESRIANRENGYGAGIRNLLDGLDGDFGRGAVVAEHVLVDLECGQAEGDLVLELRGEPLLHDVIAGLEKKYLNLMNDLQEQIRKYLRNPSFWQERKDTVVNIRLKWRN